MLLHAVLVALTTPFTFPGISLASPSSARCAQFSWCFSGIRWTEASPVLKVMQKKRRAKRKQSERYISPQTLSLNIKSCGTFLKLFRCHGERLQLTDFCRNYTSGVNEKCISSSLRKLQKRDMWPHKSSQSKKRRMSTEVQQMQKPQVNTPTVVGHFSNCVMFCGQNVI